MLAEYDSSARQFLNDIIETAGGNQTLSLVLNAIDEYRFDDAADLVEELEKELID